MRNTLYAMFSVAVIACANTSALFANGVVSVDFVPQGLSYGDTYQIAFVTEGLTGAFDPFVAYYDRFVESEAVAPGALTETWGIDWNPIAATVFYPYAFDNAPITAPVYNLAGELIAFDAGEFWSGSRRASIELTQFGTMTSLDEVWTGMDDNGGYNYTLTGSLGSSSGTAWFGFPTAEGTWWSTFATDDQFLGRPMYAVSQELTVIPEPTTLGTCLMLTGLGSISGFGRRDEIVQQLQRIVTQRLDDSWHKRLSDSARSSRIVIPVAVTQLTQRRTY